MAEDPIRAKSEFGAEWRQPGDDFVPLDIVVACTDRGVKDRPPQPEIRYFGYVDSAGGTGKDSWVTALAHRESDGLVVLDKILERRPRFVPAQVCTEHAALLALYGVHEVRGDAFGAAWVRDEHARHGITYLKSSRNTSEVCLNALPSLLAGRARLLDNARLREQLTGLQRTVHAQGRESVAAGGGTNAHDDVAVACLGAIGLAASSESFDAEPLPAGGEAYRRYDDEPDYLGGAWA
jgi:hypothetical protein